MVSRHKGREVFPVVFLLYFAWCPYTAVSQTCSVRFAFLYSRYLQVKLKVSLCRNIIPPIDEVPSWEYCTSRLLGKS